MTGMTDDMNDWYDYTHARTHARAQARTHTHQSFVSDTKQGMHGLHKPVYFRYRVSLKFHDMKAQMTLREKIHVSLTSE